MAHLNPDVLLIDEALAVGDFAFRRKCIEHMQKYVQSGGSLILVAHDLYALQCVCSQCIFLDNGQIQFAGNAVETLNRYFEFLQLSGENLGEYASLKTASNETHQVSTPPAHKQFPLQETASHLPDSCEEPVLITGLSLTSVDGGVIQTGKDARVVLKYRANRKIQCAWGFTICTADNRISIGTATAGLTDNRSFWILPGTGQLSCIIPSLPLMTGKYCLKAGIVDAHSKIPLADFGWSDSPGIFFVRARGTQDSNVQSIIGSLIEIPAVWE
jgi:hypothetical protein